MTPESGAYKAGIFIVALGSSNAISRELMYGHDDLYYFGLELGA